MDALREDGLPAITQLDRELAEAPHRISALAGDGWVGDFEDAFAKWLGTPYVQATCNATGAFVTALAALGIGPGDEVVMPTCAWVGTASAIRLVGAIPVWADLDPTTLQVAPDSVEAAISERTRAILAVHLSGHACAIHELAAIARNRGLHLIEDAAQALGAVVSGTAVGRFGDFGFFSLGPGKLLEAGEGGVLVARTRALHERALLVAQHPLRQEIEVSQTELRERIGSLLTLNFRIHPLACALALRHLPGLDERIARQRRAYADLRRALSAIDWIRVPRLTPEAKPNGAALPIGILGTDLKECTTELSRLLAREGHALACGPVGLPCHLRSDPHRERRAPVSLLHSEARCAPGQELFARIGGGDA